MPYPALCLVHCGGNDAENAEGGGERVAETGADGVAVDGYARRSVNGYEHFTFDLNIKNLPEGRKIPMDDKRINELWEIARRLRRECPWDREQTHATMRRYLIEEAYEAAEAITDGDDEALKEELGDLLLHVFMHAIIAEERGAFTMDDVAAHVADKLQRRHPHVFGDVAVAGPAQVVANWETIKGREEGGKLLLDGIPRGLPAMLRAHRIQDRARSVGFEWEDARGVLDKIEEEVGELRREINAGDKGRIRAELGDMLFSLVNLCRYWEVDPQEALNGTNDEFIRRFHAMQRALAAEGKELTAATLAEMEEKWQEAK